MNPKVTLQYLVDVTKIACSEFPDLHPHFFSAPEIWHAALHSNVSIQTALQQLWDAGLRTIPGGGAEVLSERLYQQLSPLKISPKNWLLLHELAHRIGFRTTATMMFGHFETPEEIVAHLDALRTLQDKTGGFSSFIPWSFKRTNTPLSKTVTSQASPLMYLRLIALSRIYLDNFEHIGASWFGEGKQTGMNALNFGADDFGGTLFEESVHKATGYSNVTSEQEVLWMIRHSGFVPAERDAMYRIVKIHS
jgi:CofH subfamily radical SAM domain protein